MALIQDFTIFQDDDVTPLIGTVDGSGNVTSASVSTDPTHPRPYLKPVERDIVNSEVRFKEGTSIMGGCQLEIVDVPQTAGQQRTGWLTARLAASATGNTQLLMRRGVLRQMDGAGAMRVVFDGVIIDPQLTQAQVVTYQLSLRSIRERERNNPIFMHASIAGKQGTSVVPAGATLGYGTIQGTNTQIVKPAGWEYGIWRQDPNSGLNGIYAGRIDFHDPARYSTQWWSDWSVKRLEVFQQLGAPNPVYDPTTAGYIETRYPMVQVQWRLHGTSNAFVTIANMPQPSGMRYDYSNAFCLLDRGLQNSANGHGNTLSYIMMTSRTRGDLPNDGDTVDVRVLSAGPPSGQVPLIIETPFWQLLKDLYDGVYAFDPNTAPRVRYDPVVMAALIANSPMARAIISKPETDMAKWVAENIYKPLGYAPAENENGQITPVSFALPDASASLLTLNDANVTSADWSHTRDEAVSSTLFTYQRDYVRPPDAARTHYDDIVRGKAFDMSVDFERLTAQDVQIRRIAINSTTLFGDKPLTYAPMTVRTVTTSDTGLTMTGDVGDELGAKLAQATGYSAIDRFSQGAQKLSLTALQSDAGVRAAKVGDWCVVACSWLPDYASGTRGMNRLMQIIQIRTPSGTARQFTLLDAGPHGQPIAQPTLGAPTQSGGIVSVAVSNIATNSAALIQYAISATQPAANSVLWTLLARTTAAGTFSTPPMPNGTTVWTRATGVAPGRRTSAPTNPQSVSVPVLPVVTGIRAALNTDGTVTINWAAGANAAAVRIAWGVGTDPVTAPTLGTTQDADATLNTVNLSGLVLASGQYLYYAVTPYSGWSGSAATGTAGAQSATLRAGNLPNTVLGAFLFATSTPNGDGTYTIAWSGPAGTTVSVDGGAPGTPSASPFNVTQDLYDHQYVFSGTSNGQTINENVVVPAVFKVGPELSYTIDANGALTVGIVARRGTDRTFVLARTTSAKPTAAEILAGQELGPGVGSGNLPYAGLNIGVGQKFIIGAISETSGGQQSDPAYLQGIWLGVGVTPIPVVTFGTAQVASNLVTLPITLSPTAQRVEFFKVQSHSPLGPTFVSGGNTYFTAIDVEGIAAEVFDWIERKVDGTYQTSISFPCTRPGDLINITAVVTDALGQRGVSDNFVTQTPSAVTTPPNALSLGAVTNITSTSADVPVTIPSSGTAISTVKVYRDGVFYASVAATTAGATQTITVAGMLPGTAHTLGFSGVAADGTEGPVTTTSSFNTIGGTSGGGTGGSGGTTPATGKLATPTGLSAVWSDVDQVMSIGFSEPAGNPSSTMYHLFRSTNNVTFIDIGNPQPHTPVLSPENKSATHSTTVYYKVQAVDSTGAYTSSDQSSSVTGVVPQGRS